MTKSRTGGTHMEYLDIVDEQGQPTGEIISRTLAHTKGIRHRTAHIWIVRRKNEHFQVLMQKRAMSKDSFPGKYDTSSAGHIQAAMNHLPPACGSLRKSWASRQTGGSCICRMHPRKFYRRIPRKNLPGQRNCLCLCLSAACRYRDTRPAKRGGGIGAVV